jgi:heme/copper-type cytochrome/quinol oxidase subunit 2
MADKLELFNAHQEDVRRRADSLAKSIFVLSGGTLTLSIGIFTGSSAPDLSPFLSCILKTSWWGLFLAIMFLALTLITIIARDYAFGERWRKQLNGQNIDVSGNPTFVEIIIWVLAIIGILAFLAGILGQAYVASNVI